MNSTASTSNSHALSSSALAEENALLREQLGVQSEMIRQLKHQLDWFKKHLFGPKSEKQVIDLPGQSSLFESEETPVPETPTDDPRTVRAYQRGSARKQRDDDSLNDTGLRFTARVDGAKCRSVRRHWHQNHVSAGSASRQLRGAQAGASGVPPQRG